MDHGSETLGMTELDIDTSESVWPDFAPHVRRRVAVGNLIAAILLGILIFAAGFLTAALIFGAHR